ncbi:type I restriction enzyme, S subunit [Prevotella sp. ne3005]|uniref:restriction endonuclease subunit S n=1 Tax=Prevotella sp. ne3005 TaxID=1761887 RepID=UPI0008AD111E|nr:restriction endonuclease subunit S [Prevotella sp. ne3005]SEN12902.1 type I restriction enzyme, S subunit [Prevotella sp. ne3005]
MNAQQLKNAILQEAIEGRLIPQDPNDEPASILLERIRKEKERLVKEGKLKKKDLEVKPISEDEIPFEIPESWEWVRLSNLIQLLSGQDFPPEKYNSEKKGTPYITGASNISNGRLHINRWTETPSVIGIEGDLLIVCKGSGVGKMCICDIPKIHIARQIQIIRPLSSTVLIDYVRIVVNANMQSIVSKAQGVIPGISREDVLDLNVPFPPYAEQKRIVAKIEELLPKVEKYGKTQDELNKLNEELPERLKKSILQEAIEGRLVPQDPNDEPASVLLQKIREEKQQLVKAGKLKKKDLIETPISEDEIPFAIPDSWEWCNLFDCVDILYGYPFDSTAFNENSLGFPLIRIRDIIPSSTKTYTTEKAEERYVIKKGDMLVGMDGNFNVCFWKSDNAYLNQRVCKITAKESILNQKYLYYYLPYELEEIFKTVSYVTVKHLSDKHFRTMRIPLPPLAEQKRIVAKLEQLLGEIDKLKK